MKRLFLVLILILVIFSAYCQYPEINYEHLSVRQGLADNAINCIIQDHAGFIWIGGNNGIYKYDGYDFTIVNDLSGCRNCPSFKKVFSIREDNLGLLWILSDIGITLYNPENGKAILIYQILWDSAHMQSDLSKCLLRDSQGNIWASSQQGLIKISYQKHFKESAGRDSISDYSVKDLFKIESVQLSSDKYGPDNSVLSAYEDQQENIWVGCLKGIFILKKGDKTFTRLDSQPKKGLTEVLTSVRDILQLNEHSYWIISQNELCLLENVNSIFHDSIPDRSSLHITRKKLKDGRPAISLSVDHQKNYLVATTDDLYKIKRDERTGEILFEPLFQERTEKEDNIVNFKQIQSIFEDRSDVIWAAHALYGISKFNLIQSQFTSYKNLIINNFTDDNIDLIYKDTPGNLWLGTFNGGFYKIQPGTKKVIHYDTGSLKNRIICMQEISPGFFLLGSNKGILEFNSESGKFSDPLPDTKIANNLRVTGVADMLKDGNQFYIGTINGLFIYNILDKKLFQFTFNDNDSVIDYNNAILSIIKLKNGEILASSCYHGINKIDSDPRNGTISFKPVITNKLLTDNGIIDVERHTLYEDSKGLLWIVNYSGLHRINVKNLEVKNYKLFENIEFPQACSIIEDDHNNLWVGTHKGLCRFNTATERLRIFDKNNGLPVSIHGFNTVYKEEGILYFGGLGGFYSFHPDSLKTNDSIPPVVITDFRIFNKSIMPGTATSDILQKYISYAHIVKLRPNQNDLSFHFAALDYNQPLKNKYAYKLEGYQNNWIQTNADDRYATYNQLNPGKYTFRVKGSNNDGAWNEKGASLVIIIQKPWWATVYAWCIYLIVFAGATGGFVYRREWKLKKEKLILEVQVGERTRQIEVQKDEILIQRDKLEEQNQKITELDELKSRFFTNVSHEFRTPLSLIQSPVEELLDDPRRNEKERRKLNIIQRNTQRLLNLVNQLLDISKIDGSKMKLELVEEDVMKHLKAVGGSFSSLAETKSIHYLLHFSKEEIKTWFDPDKLDKVTINLLSNAFKFTPEGGEVTLSAHYKSSEDPKISHILEILVIDTGTGIPAGSLEKVFDRFYQVESSLKKEGGGTGIGLSLAREMAHLMHGDITIKSENCQGSTFYFHFPLGKDHLNESEFVLLKGLPETVAFLPNLFEITDDDRTKQELKSTHKNPVLLIVEDNRDIRIQIAENFDKDYIIYEAFDGVSGLKKATDLIPDLIITDLMMPRLDGLELCEKLKSDERTSHIPIIMLTAKVTQEDKITGLQTGADDYMPKPFSMAELKVRVKNLIEQRIKLRERFSREVTLEPHDISITSVDEKFLKRAIEVIELHLNDEEFDLVRLRKEMNMSRSTLFRKLHALTGQSPTEFIRTIRLKRAASLLKQKFGNVTQVSLEVGFNNLSYFNRSFKKLFGLTPIEYSKTV